MFNNSQKKKESRWKKHVHRIISWSLSDGLIDGYSWHWYILQRLATAGTAHPSNVPPSAPHVMFPLFHVGRIRCARHRLPHDSTEKKKDVFTFFVAGTRLFRFSCLSLQMTRRKRKPKRQRRQEKTEKQEKTRPSLSKPKKEKKETPAKRQL